jgi:hypothetical protein
MEVSQFAGRENAPGEALAWRRAVARAARSASTLWIVAARAVVTALALLHASEHLFVRMNEQISPP